MKFRLLFLLSLLLFTFPASPSHAVTGDEAYQEGLTLYKNGQWEQSIDQFREAVRQNPNHWQAYQSMGYAFVQDGDPRAALDACRISLQINPHNSALQAYVDTKLKALVENAPPDLPQPSSTATTASEAPFKARNAFYFDIGGVSPISPLNSSNGYSLGYNFGLGYEFAISPGFSLVLDLNYSTHPLNAGYSSSNDTSTYTGGGVHPLIFTFNGRFNFIDPDDPSKFYDVYTVMGFGPALTILDPETLTVIYAPPNNYLNSFSSYPGVTELDFALRFGVGVDFKLNPSLALFAEANFVDLFTSLQIKYGTFDQYRGSAGLKVKY